MTFSCLPNCGDCCGVVPLKKNVVAKNLNKLQVNIKEHKAVGEEIAMITEDSLCAFLNRDTKRCEIYEDRPEICKLFCTGIDQEGQENVLLYCPHLKPSGNKWSEAKRKHLLRRVKQVEEGVYREMNKKYGKDTKVKN